VGRIDVTGAAVATLRGSSQPSASKPGEVTRRRSLGRAELVLSFSGAGGPLPLADRVTAVIVGSLHEVPFALLDWPTRGHAKSFRPRFTTEFRELCP
jgi:hypothetical protein